MHQPGYLLLGGELLPAHGAQVVYQGYHVGAAEMGHAADETEIFLYRILQHDDVAFTHQHTIKQYAGQVEKEFQQFVVVEGPVEDSSVDFRDKNPDVISFDQVKDVWLEVDEYWTEGNGEFDPKPLSQNLTQDKYKDVYWRYDFYLNIATDHPYAETIRYKMNYKPTITKVPQRGIFFRRGVGIGGTYRGKEIAQLALELQAFDEDEQKAEEFRKKLDAVLLKNKGKSMFESVTDGLKRDASNMIYFRKLAIMGAHVARAERISRLLLG